MNSKLQNLASSEQDFALFESLPAHGLLQVNRLTNINGRLLDLVFVNSSDVVELVDPPLPLLPVDSHHKPFALLLDVHSGVEEKPLVSMEMDFRRCNYEELNNAIASVDWQLCFVEGAIDTNTSCFYERLFEILDAHVPRVRLVSNRLSRRPWWTTELRHMRNTLRKARTRFFRSRSTNNYTNLRNMEMSYKNLLTATHSEYIRKIERDLKQNPASFWKYVRSLKGNPRIPTNMAYEGMTANSDAEAAKLFAEFFRSVYRTDAPIAHAGSFETFLELSFSVDDVRKALEVIDVSKGAGVDGLPPIFLMNFSDTELFQPPGRQLG